MAENPFAQYAPPPPAANPFAEFQPPPVAAPSEIPQRQGMDLAAQYAGVINRAVAPYITAQTAAPIIGPLSLAATDITSALYNPIAGLTGLPAMQSGSEAIRSLYPQQVFREPETSGQAIFGAGLEAATGARGTATAFGQAADQLNALRQLRGGAPTTTENVLSTMAQRPGGQAIASAGGATAQQTAIESSERDSIAQNPVVMATIGVLGSALAGRAALRGPQTIKELAGKGTASEEQMYQQAKAKYREVDQSGVAFSSQAYDRMLFNLRQRLDDAGYTDQPAIKAALNKLEKFSGMARYLTDIDTARSDITKTLIKSQDENVRRLGREMADELDDFVLNASPNDVLSGNLPRALSNLNEARQLWTKISRSEQMSELLRRAKLSGQPLDAAVRDEFRSLARDERRFNKFTPDEQQFILNVVEGGNLAKSLTDFSEALRVQRSLGGTLYAGAFGFSTPLAAPIGQIDPATAVAIMGGVAATRAGTSAVANTLAAQRAQRAAAAMRGFRPEPLAPLAFPTAQAAIRPGDVNFLSQSEVLNALSGR